MRKAPCLVTTTAPTGPRPFSPIPLPSTLFETENLSGAGKTPSTMFAILIALSIGSRPKPSSPVLQTSALLWTPSELGELSTSNGQTTPSLDKLRGDLSSPNPLLDSRGCRLLEQPTGSDRHLSGWMRGRDACRWFTISYSYSACSRVLLLLPSQTGGDGNSRSF